MPLRTGSCSVGVGVGLMQPVIVLMLLFNAMLMSLVCLLFIHTGEQYSATEYDRASEDIRRTSKLAVQLAPASLRRRPIPGFDFC